MRCRRQHAGLIVNAIAGTHVVFFGLDLAKSKRAGFRGFGFKRFDHVEGDTIWLQGLKLFQKTEPYPATGERFSTLHHPIQSFQWADYSAKPGTAYTYTVVALYGDPPSLERRIELGLDITTERETGSVHSAFFNRGSVATQEYARPFQNHPPSEAGPGAANRRHARRGPSGAAGPQSSVMERTSSQLANSARINLLIFERHHVTIVSRY